MKRNLEMTQRAVPSRRTRLLRLLAWLLLLPLAYLAAALTGGAIPANPAWQAPGEGVTVFVEDNGVHTGIVIPKAALGPQWRAQAAGEGLRDLRYAAQPYLALGWGDRAFYLETPRWRDLRPATALAALVGSDRTVLHVEHVAVPVPSHSVRRLVLRPQEFARLVDRLAATQAVGAPVPGYGRHDLFYPARGRYSAITTCNAWTGEVLRAAGVRMGRWTPFSFQVMAWL